MSPIVIAGCVVSSICGGVRRWRSHASHAKFSPCWPCRCGSTDNAIRLDESTESVQRPPSGFGGQFCPDTGCRQHHLCRAPGCRAAHAQPVVCGAEGDAGLHGADGRVRCHSLEPVAALELALAGRSEEHTSELQSLMRISYAVFCL